jgi:uncharacterized protein (DUF305 family)
MKQENILYGIVGLLVGVGIAVFTATTAVNSSNRTMMQMMGMNTESGQLSSDHGAMTMDDMSNAIKGKTGDEFDKAFLSEMIVHHQGAIDMAMLAQSRAKHDEIKKLADAILSAQSQEIDKMQAWQTDWGYKDTPTMMMHGNH